LNHSRIRRNHGRIRWNHGVCWSIRSMLPVARLRRCQVERGRVRLHTGAAPGSGTSDPTAVLAAGSCKLVAKLTVRSASPD